jgi:threonyl-tRNA synthetase
MDKTQLDAVRHSLAHLLAMAVLEYDPQAKPTIGPAIDDGFYYDFELSKPIGEADLPALQARMIELAASGLTFERSEAASHAQALKQVAGNKYKEELVAELSEDEPVTFYASGNFTDLCRGGHVANTKDIVPASFCLDRVAGAYWRGDEHNAMLTRIYGLAFESKAALDEYKTQREEAKKRDHKKLGPELDLFTFSDLVGSGLPLWTPRGTTLRDLLDAYVWELRSAAGYERVEIPHITKKELYEKSGHWQKFQDELFKITTREGHLFVMKPMNCPHHTQIYARRAWSYRDLPQRYANTTMCYRDEQSGELAGLSRVRSLTQDDAHVFCRMGQVREEFLKVWDIVHAFYGTFGFQMRVRLSLHDPAKPDAYLGDAARWKEAEEILRNIITEKGGDWYEGLGEAAFYGPKLDFMAKDSLGRSWQVATIQLDMNMPERFDLTCKNEAGEDERIVMIHAAIMGSIERFLSIAIEHFAGAFPMWLAPEQVRIASVAETHIAAAQQLANHLRGVGLRVGMDSSNESVGKKIRAAELIKVPYSVVVGDKEAAGEPLQVRTRGQKELWTGDREALTQKLLELNAKRSLDL